MDELDHATGTNALDNSRGNEPRDVLRGSTQDAGKGEDGHGYDDGPFAAKDLASGAEDGNGDRLREEEGGAHPKGLDTSALEIHGDGGQARAYYHRIHCADNRYSTEEKHGEFELERLGTVLLVL